jgi:hypothetical protein
MPDRSVTVAIFDGNCRLVDLWERVPGHAGFRTVNGHVADMKGEEKGVLAIVAQHEPHVLVWDISSPSDQNWAFLIRLRASAVVAGRGVVVTTATGNSSTPWLPRTQDTGNCR